jgi:hypothetical protein
MQLARGERGIRRVFLVAPGDMVVEGREERGSPETARGVVHQQGQVQGRMRKEREWGGNTLVTEYIFYCKRAILFLSSSKILTPHPPLRPASVYPPPLLWGRTDSPGGEGDGGSIFWKTREIGLPSYSKICTL